MRIFLKALLLFALIFAAAYLARALIVPDVVPIADRPQPGWQVQVAFLLTSVQNIGAFGMVLVMVLAAMRRLKSLVAR